jgi:hypothetical protein
MPSRHAGKSRPIEQLRLSIDCLPIATREAMLRGVHDAQRVIAGAYVDPQGGVCPMLAAHRAGGRTDLLAFARAWDRFTRAGRGARAASKRELAILVGQLQASLAGERGGDIDLAAAIAAHRELQRARGSEEHALQGTREPEPLPTEHPLPPDRLCARRGRRIRADRRGARTLSPAPRTRARHAAESAPTRRCPTVASSPRP